MICLSKKAMMRYSKYSLVLKDRESMLKINQELRIVPPLDVGHERRAPRIHVRASQILQPIDETGGSTAPDNPTQRRFQRLIASQHQWADHVTHVETKVEQLRHEFRQAMVDSALTQGVMQEVQGQGQGMERIRHALFNIAMEKLDGLDARFQSMMNSCNRCWQRLIDKVMRCAPRLSD